MYEKVRVAMRTPQARSPSILLRKHKAHKSASQDSAVDRILHLQGTAGNQVVQRMIQSGALQAKLRIGRPNDRYEQEADRVADQVMRMPDIQRSPACSSCGEREKEEPIRAKPLAGQITPFVQRQVEPEEEEEEEPLQTKLVDSVHIQRQEEEPEEEEEEPLQTKLVDGIRIQRQEEEPEEEEEEPLQTKLADGAQIQRQEEEPEEEEEEEPIQTKRAGGQTPHGGRGIEAQVHSIRDGGQPLPASARAFFEPRFGYDFSQVRVHTGTRAASSSRTVNAQAFTVGRNVVFGAGQYAPETVKGQCLLAHELTHVVQQNGMVQNKIQS